VGLIVDTNVFVSFERRAEPIDLSRWNPSEDVFISSITASELLMRVHRANTESRRNRRSAFVEAIIGRVSVLSFNTEIARVHAEIGAHLARGGQSIGAHDLIIAATARHHGLTLLTDNTSQFSRVPALSLISFSV
jgi:predicted nucleic acid-binding protein